MPALDEMDAGAHPTLGVRETAERREALDSLTLSGLFDDEADTDEWE
jgi:hypothetical protein